MPTSGSSIAEWLAQTYDVYQEAAISLTRYNSRALTADEGGLALLFEIVPRCSKLPPNLSSAPATNGSGETEDNWLADLAVGWSSDFIKLGCITQSERLAKYNRLLEMSGSSGYKVTRIRRHAG